jgi:hypothetical protein
VYGGPVHERAKVRPMEGRASRMMVFAAFAVVLLTDALYLGLLMSQGDRPPDTAFTVPFVVGYLLLMAGLLGISLLRRRRIVAARTALRAGAAGGLLVLGVLAAMWIGLALILAGALATGAAVRTVSRPHWKPSAVFGVAAATLAVVLLVAGFEITERMIVCPAHGSMGGGGSGLVTGPYYYDCVNGQLSYHSGSCSSSSIDSSGNVSHPGC